VVEVLEKVCTKCQILKSISHYGIADSKFNRLRGDCKSCRSEITKAWYYANKEGRSKTIKKWSVENRDRKKATTSQWQDNNRQKLSEYGKRYYNKYPGKMAEKRTLRRQIQVNWVSDLDRKIMNEIYKKAKYYTKLTGIKYVVDHIIPVKGKNVSGLHVPTNLRVMPALLNTIKGNTFDNAGATY
jgi:hypothetical protein